MWKKVFSGFVGLVVVVLLVGSMFIHNSVQSDVVLKGGMSVPVVNGKIDRDITYVIEGTDDNGNLGTLSPGFKSGVSTGVLSRCTGTGQYQVEFKGWALWPSRILVVNGVDFGAVPSGVHILIKKGRIFVNEVERNRITS